MLQRNRSKTTNNNLNTRRRTIGGSNIYNKKKSCWNKCCSCSFRKVFFVIGLISCIVYVISTLDKSKKPSTNGLGSLLDITTSSIQSAVSTSTKNDQQQQQQQQQIPIQQVSTKQEELPIQQRKDEVVQQQQSQINQEDTTLTETNGNNVNKDTTTTNNNNNNNNDKVDDDDDDDDDNDKDCIFRNSPIYRKVYVYPNPGEKGWEGDILSDAGKNNNATAMKWPWIEIDKIARQNARSHYNIESQNVQYSTELLVREIIINPKSCLRTYNPDEATLFYVPYLPSTEHHLGDERKLDFNTSPYGQAIMDIIDKQEYTNWENYFGLTSKYWKQRNGTDHILVFSEPMHGLYHPRNKRGNFHFINTQKQLNTPIVISVELSTTFIQMYPKCSITNILVPYPNTHGSWYNGKYIKDTQNIIQTTNLTVYTSDAVLPAEKEYAITINATLARPVAQYYSAGNHGTCAKLRKAMKADYNTCSKSFPTLTKKVPAKHNSIGMRLSTFCPCPGGDSPSAKRMFDALIAGCIPIILSEDFVWPFTKEFDNDTYTIDPLDFSIRLDASDYDTPLLDSKTCQPIDTSKPGLQKKLEEISVTEINRLRQGADMAGKMYSWYKYDTNLPDNPLKDGILPNGGTAHYVVQALADRALGQKYEACKEEIKKNNNNDFGHDNVRKFKC